MLTTALAFTALSSVPFIVSVSGYYAYRFYKNRNIPKVFSRKPTDGALSLGLSVVDYEIPEENEEQYLNRLKTLYPSAWTEYFNSLGRRKIFDEADRHVNMLILKHRNGEINAKVGNYTIDFEDGTKVWIANKYYSYGNVYECKRTSLKFDNSSYRLSPYTFMSLVDLEQELNSYTTWKRYHDNYSRLRFRTIKELLMR